MHLVERFWVAATSVLNLVTLNPHQSHVEPQSPLKIHTPSQVHGPAPIRPPAELVVPSQHEDGPIVNLGKGPSFEAPGAPEDEPFPCKYPAMVGWESCSTKTDRRCWLRRKSDGKQYDINTDYENDKPIGVVRQYTIVLEDSWYAADGINFTSAKLFNNSYPGPWIQACWGDRLVPECL